MKFNNSSLYRELSSPCSRAPAHFPGPSNLQPINLSKILTTKSRPFPFFGKIGKVGQRALQPPSEGYPTGRIGLLGSGDHPTGECPCPQAITHECTGARTEQFAEEGDLLLLCVPVRVKTWSGERTIHAPREATDLPPQNRSRPIEGLRLLLLAPPLARNYHSI
ncbi:MAG: hypothetical protein QGG48_11145 [Desulfatiglandales bacterium]|nr:hypothetical protein [Desulfatiglandales bacterium]